MIYPKKNINPGITLFICVSFLFTIVDLKGQQNRGAVKKDTISIKKGSTLIINNKRYKINTDTSIILPSNLKYNIELSKEDRFYNRIEKQAKNNFWTRELHDIIITDSRLNKPDTFKTTLSTKTFEAYRKRPIRNIIIKQLPVFGPTISDTLQKPKTILEHTANRLHFQTRKFLIQKNLLFKEQDWVDPDVLADNERVLRSLPYIDDTKIDVLPLGSKTDSVDILVIVKDNWSMAFDLKIDNINTGNLDILHKNIFGFGQEIKNSALWDKTKRPGWGYESSYTIPNIAGSFFKGTILYNRSFGDQTLSFNLNREFFTPNIKYAGGFSFKNVKSDIRYFQVSPPQNIPIEYNELGIWTGRSFLLTPKNTKRSRQNLSFAGKIILDKFYDRPVITENSYYELHNKTLFLFSVIYTNQNFYESNLIYNFGRTEDIPVGGKLGLTTGYEFNEFHNRKYLSGEFATGKFLGTYGYLSTSAALGAFFNRKETEQGILTANLKYFSNLFVVNRFNFRQFITLDLTKGISRFQREFITMNEKLGLTGYRNDSIYGNQRFHIKGETVCFTPWKTYDFKFVLFMYADYTWLSGQSQNLFYGSPYSSFGFGVRLRNERLVFNTIQLRISFYPNIPPGRTNFINLSGEPILSPPDFSPKAPKLTDFR
jgi:hypothetical protein